MSRFLVLTTDLPYFPGKMGLDFFNLRHLAQAHAVGVVSLCHATYPEEAVANLRRFLDGAFFWPQSAEPVPLLVNSELQGTIPRWIARAPAAMRRWLLRKLLAIDDKPVDAFDKLVALAHSAPHLLHALSLHHWDALVLIQSSLEPWLDYLPAAGARVVYFHDVRSDYLRRALPIPGTARPAVSELAAIRRQEERITERADVVAFVSDLDRSRAARLFPMRAHAGVAPIAVDTDYFRPRPPDWVRDPRPLVLFTGHLAHPPNVDAVLHFMREIWPRVLERVPSAVFQVAGMLPVPALEEAIRRTRRCELHANVPDIRPFFWNASVYVVPMRFGGGVRQKLFEAWSMETPVVCSPMAAEGTQAKDCTHCWIAADDAAFAERVSHVLETSHRRDGHLDEAKRLADAHAITQAAPRFQALVERAAAIRRRRAFKVLFDLRWMQLGAAGGIEQATYELVSALARVDRRNAYRLLGPRSSCWEWDLPREFDVSVHYSDAPEQLVEIHRAFLANRLAESLGLFPVLTPPMRSLAAYRRLDFDLVHSVCGYTSADLRSFPGILTINDLQHLQYPQFFGEAEWRERETLYRASAMAAKRIICISEFTRQDVHERYGIPLDKLTTIWLIPSRSVWRTLPEARCRRLLADMGVAGPFLFFPAHGWPHKNHARLVQAFQLARPRLPKDLRLVFTGRPFAPDHEAARRMRESGPDSGILHLGWRSPLEVRALFQACHALVFPSLFEGFGMPVAEAIIAGKPVACSNATSLPEIAGDAAVMFDPNDVQDMAAKIEQVATDEALRAALAAAALRRRALFSARDTAARTLAVYARVFAEVYGGGE